MDALFKTGHQTPRHQITRLRRDTRRRLLTVTDVRRITPRMQRIWFESPDLSDFESAAPDDHIKLFLPASHVRGEAGAHE